MQNKTELPISKVIPKIIMQLKSNNRLVLQAPPGAGKTTTVPLELLNETWLKDKKIIMLEPRRIAARNAAYWMSQTLNQKVGNRIGYTVHLDKKVSKDTVIEVVTEGVFLNRLLKDPELKDVALVIFDEFHERSLETDLGLALIKETQEILREDLKILVMSATLDSEPVAKYLNNAPVITSKGKSFPVEVRYIDDSVTNTVIDAINNQKGSILVFLPGIGEIKKALNDLKSKLPSNIILKPLYSGLSREEQENAIEEAEEGMRKIVLATSIAESSITIKGVKVVIDSGLIRKPVFNPKNSMESLETRQISKASADQRAGRAGRIKPGVCYRLWDKYKKLDDFDTPAIINSDFTSGLLTLSKWGYTDINQVEWLSSPNRSIYENSYKLLKSLGAINSNGITRKGEALTLLPFNPRIASIIFESNSKIALSLAAILSEKDILNFPPGYNQSDIRYRLDALEGKNIISSQVNNYAKSRVMQILKSIKYGNQSVDISKLLLNSFPDRIAKKNSYGNFYMSNGSEVYLPDFDSLYSSEFLVVTNSGGLGKIDKVYMAYPVTEQEIKKYCSHLLEESVEIEFLEDKSKFSALKIIKIGHLIIKKNRTGNVSATEFQNALLSYIKDNKLKPLDWTKEANIFCERVNFLHKYIPDKYPSFNKNNLASNLKWIKPYIGVLTIQNSLKDIPLLNALKGFFNWNQLQVINEYAPTHLKVPSGSKIPIDYTTGEPVLKVRLQELFGMLDTPKILSNSVPITFHLLSPASRPIQITKDLRSFWENTYLSVKKDLMGRYPKHYWPNDPLKATPTNRVKRKNNKIGLI